MKAEEIPEIPPRTKSASGGEDSLPTPNLNFQRRCGGSTKGLSLPFAGGKVPSPRQLTGSTGQTATPKDSPESRTRLEAADRTPSPSRKPAFDFNGPVEAVALHSDWQFWNVFQDIRTLGKGNFAKVKEVLHLEARESFAVKILDKTLAENDIEDLVPLVLRHHLEQLFLSGDRFFVSMILLRSFALLRVSIQYAPLQPRPAITCCCPSFPCPAVLPRLILFFKHHDS